MKRLFFGICRRISILLNAAVLRRYLCNVGFGKGVVWDRVYCEGIKSPLANPTYEYGIRQVTIRLKRIKT